LKSDINKQYHVPRSMYKKAYIKDCS